MKKFEIGKTYSMRSTCDHNCVWSYIVTARTASTVTLNDGIKCRINKAVSEMSGSEAVYPLGRYSMAPVLRAE